MKYIIFDEETEEGVENLRCCDLPEESERYLRQYVLPLLQPISDLEYLRGPAQVLQSLAPFSYVLDHEYVYWCIEWSPGLVVVRFAPENSLAEVKITSPNPQFGGREATREEMENFDQDASNPQYKLIFDAGGAQFDPDILRRWEVADLGVQNRWNAAMAHAQKLGSDNV